MLAHHQAIGPIYCPRSPVQLCHRERDISKGVYQGVSKWEAHLGLRDVGTLVGLCHLLVDLQRK